MSSSESAQKLLEVLAVAYADLWKQHQGLVHAVSERLGVPREVFENEIKSWLDSQSENLPPEGATRFRGILRIAGLSNDKV